MTIPYCISKLYLTHDSAQTFLSKKWEGVGTSNFTTSTGQKFQNVEMVFLVDQNIEIRMSKMAF